MRNLNRKLYAIGYTSQMRRLYCTTQNYDWGKIGTESEVYNLIKDSNANLDESRPYAELWMGTHPSGQSFLDEARERPLSTFISKFPDCVGSDSRKIFGRNLPFLFKVLSVRKALSVQAHPTKSHARDLHRSRPDLYKDANHKPEMAIALTPFEALLAFRPVAEIAWFVQNIPELLEIVGPTCSTDLCTASTSALPDAEVAVAAVATKAAYTKLMLAEQTKVEQKVEDLRNRLLANTQIVPRWNCSNGETDPIEATVNLEALSRLFIRLSEEYPGDVGCFSIFFLNYVRLEPGEAVFLEANLPHAYLSGDCIECMACSDNVVRAGLTPKFKDVDCLLSMLEYAPRTIDSLLFPGVPRRLTGRWRFRREATKSDTEVPSLLSYLPPVDEFGVDRIAMPEGYTALELVALPSASILLIIQGSGYLQRLAVGGGHIAVVRRDSAVDKASVASPNVHDEFGEAEGMTLFDDAESGEDGGDCGQPEPDAIQQEAGRFHQCLPFQRGSTFFINAGVAYCIHPVPVTSAAPLLAFRAYANVEKRNESDTISA